jgi:predicted ArsR family transcriptional regulator
MLAAPTKVSQKDQILAHLHRIENGARDSLSQMEALGLYRIYRLASRIDELRQDGYDIVTEMKVDPTGRPYARYHLNVRGSRAMPSVRKQ